MSLTALVRRWGAARLASALGCLLLLGWLIYGAVFTKSRYEAVTSALAGGQIGGLAPESSEELLRQLQWLARAAGVKEAVALNRPPAPGRLNFYTTTPAAYAVTHCARRNAVYDAELDSVFIDLGLLDNGEFRSILEASGYGSVATLSDLPFFRAYLRFIVLHELGHRQLHRGGRALFDFNRTSGGDGGRQIEEEADQFAIRAMQVAYKADAESGGEFTSKGAGDFLGLGEGGTADPAGRVWVDLVGMASAMNMYDLFLQNPYAPFYEDRAHPTFLYRARGLIAQSLREPGPDAKVRAHIAFFDKFLGREAEMLSRPLVEVISAEPIESVSFDGLGLVVASRGLKSLLRLRYSEFEPPAAGAESISLSAATAPSAGFDEDKVTLWGGAGQSPIAFGEKTYEGGGSAWAESGNEVARTLAQTSPHVYLPPQPSQNALVVSSTTQETWQERWYALRGDRVARMRPASKIAADIAARGGPAGCSLKPNTVTERKIYLTTEDCSAPSDTNKLNVAVLDAETLDVLQVVSLDLPGGLAEAQRRLVVAPAGDVESFILVSEEGKSRPRGWAAWRLFAGGEARLLTRQTYLVAESGGEEADALRSNFNPELSFAAWVPGDYLLVACNGDSVYLLNLGDNSTRVLFHPGDELLQISVSRDGRAAVYLRGGYKCYVLRPADAWA